MDETWIERLQLHVEKRRLAVLRFVGSEWERLSGSRLGVTEFTITRPHDLAANLKTPTLCLIFGQDETRALAYLGVVTRKQAVSTLDSLVKIRLTFEIAPPTESAVVALVKGTRLSNQLATDLGGGASLLLLTPKVGSAVLAALAKNSRNRRGMRAIWEELAAPKRYSDNRALQSDAVHMALKAFGLEGSAGAAMVDVPGDKSSPALTRIPIMEDAVIEHDARTFPGLTLVGSDVTGRAVFQRGDEQLEVYTANRRDLEHVFGVDLIYLNLTRQNIVMLQYKMLERHVNKNNESDWIYRPDEQLADEIARMERFSKTCAPGPLEYRLNPCVYFLKFVRRDASMSKGGIVLPIDHYQRACQDPFCIRGPRGAIRVSYEGLSGRYMREGAFLDLVRSGYIGAHAETTEHLATLVRRIVENDRAVVAAVASPSPPSPRTIPSEDDGERER
jgi:hypothetical protein